MAIIAMLDIETLGTKPGCPVAQIACLLWNTATNEVVEEFETFIRVQIGDITADAETIKWWYKQDDNLRDYVLNNPNAQYPVAGFGNFSIWAKELEEKPLVWWCKGLDFDFPIIETKLRQHGFQVPWKYNNRRDFRTVLKGFGYDAGSEFPTLPQSPTVLRQHDALSDCWNQLAALVHIGYTKPFLIDR